MSTFQSDQPADLWTGPLTDMFHLTSRARMWHS
uniref:Uncharacterized protein n=1 Tax=Anguilla anguilla TaxID=7936 RepID=A0A0E9SUJ8_ANGAN